MRKIAKIAPILTLIAMMIMGTLNLSRPETANSAAEASIPREYLQPARSLLIRQTTR